MLAYPNSFQNLTLSAGSSYLAPFNLTPRYLIARLINDNGNIVDIV